MSSFGFRSPTAPRRKHGKPLPPAPSCEQCHMRPRRKDDTLCASCGEHRDRGVAKAKAWREKTDK